MTAAPPDPERQQPEPWARREPYTVRKAISECQWPLATVMGIAACLCVLMAASGWPVYLNAAIVILLGPVGGTVAIIGRVRNHR